MDHAQDRDRHIGRNVRIIREARRVSQGQLAEDAGMTLPTVGKIERGEQSLSMDSLHLIAKLLDTTPGRLIDGPVSNRMLDLSDLSEKQAAALEALHHLLSGNAA